LPKVGAGLDLGKLLRKRRAELDVSQGEFGAIVGVPWDQSRVSRYEQGRIPLDVADEVAHVLGLPADEVREAIRRRRTVPHPPRERPGFEQRLTSVERRVTALEDAVTSGEPPAYTAMLAELRRMKEQLLEVAFEELDADAEPESESATHAPR
jgi:transcriptional regulator with XRE-family HTH domain